MILSVVVAMAQNRVIGQGGTLPWHLPADLRRFRAITMGKPILMGRRTQASIGRVLPGRRNIVLSRDRNFTVAGCEHFSTLDDALTALADVPEVMVIGGAQLYAEALPLAVRLYLTEVVARVDGDVFFPSYDPSEWIEQSSDAHAADADHAFAYCFRVFERLNRKLPQSST